MVTLSCVYMALMGHLRKTKKHSTTQFPRQSLNFHGLPLVVHVHVCESTIVDLLSRQMLYQLSHFEIAQLAEFKLSRQKQVSQPDKQVHVRSTLF